MTRMTICLAAVAAAIALPATSALAMDSPPASSPGGSSSSGGAPSSSGGSPPSSSGGPASIPEPAAIGLFALGIAGAAFVRRRSRRKQD